jgi:malonyl-CoA/methylmalonyl-CoA synthetase
MPDRNFNLYHHFRQCYAGKEDRVVLLTAQGRELTFAELDHQCAQIARLLRDIGVKPGDRVSAQLRKSPENLILYLACLRSGLVFHPLNHDYRRSELEYFIGNARPEVIVCDSDRERVLGEIARSVGVKHRFTLNQDGSGTLMDSSVARAGAFATQKSLKNDLAALLYSSGTTGQPKGIMLTHGNLLSNAETLVEAWGFTSGDRLLHALPIYHVHGLFVAVGCVMLSGASMRWLNGYDAEQVINFLPECSVMMGVPTYYTRLLSQASLSAGVCGNMRLFISGSAPLLEETFAEFEERTGHRILERYGMTETNMNTSNPLNGERKPGTVGPALAGVELRITGDDGQAVTSGEIGHIQVCGPNVFAGYWQMPEKTAEDFTGDGYFNTGDMGRIDAEGYVSIVGRNKDLIITGGLNVYPKEVELFIDDLSGVKESAVIGVPHPDFGEAVVAIVVPEPRANRTESEIIEACKAELAGFKVPKSVVVVDALPRNAMAKVQKNMLRERYADLLN